MTKLTKFKVGDTVKFTPEWAASEDEFFTVTAINEERGEYELKEIPHGFYDIGTDDTLEMGSAFKAQVQKVYAADEKKQA